MAGIKACSQLNGTIISNVADCIYDNILKLSNDFINLTIFLNLSDLVVRLIWLVLAISIKVLLLLLINIVEPWPMKKIVCELQEQHFNTSSCC